MVRELDAYGHLNWTVGNEDWIACFDAVRTGDALAYQVVVDCVSGAFLDTLEAGTIAVSDTDKIENLKSLPDYWADICREHYAHSRKREHRVKVRDLARTRKQWAEHLDDLTCRRQS